jgi:hypothetical protein
MVDLSALELEALDTVDASPSRWGGPRGFGSKLPLTTAARVVRNNRVPPRAAAVVLPGAGVNRPTCAKDLFAQGTLVRRPSLGPGGSTPFALTSPTYVQLVVVNKRYHTVTLGQRGG